MDDFDFDFGQDDDGEERRIAMAVTRRAANSVELVLRERLHIDRQAALGDVDEVPFSETDDDEEQQRARAHLALVARLTSPAAEKWSRQIEVARDLGPKGTAKMYEAGCAEMEIEPWPT